MWLIKSRKSVKFWQFHFPSHCSFTQQGVFFPVVIRMCSVKIQRISVADPDDVCKDLALLYCEFLPNFFQKTKFMKQRFKWHRFNGINLHIKSFCVVISEGSIGSTTLPQTISLNAFKHFYHSYIQKNYIIPYTNRTKWQKKIFTCCLSYSSPYLHLVP
jgi:hypothetical protein